jgi:hypothetical protein
MAQLGQYIDGAMANSCDSNAFMIRAAGDAGGASPSEIASVGGFTPVSGLPRAGPGGRPCLRAIVALATPWLRSS